MAGPCGGLGCVGVLLALLCGSAAAQGGARPLGAADIEGLLRDGVTPARLATLVEQRGVSFEMSPALDRQLRAAGADDRLIAAVERAALAAERRRLDEEKARLQADREAAEREQQAAAAKAKADAAAEAERARQAVTALVVRSNVSGDTVLIDGVEVGPSSARPCPVTPGAHTVELRKPGLPSETKRVEVAEGETKTVRFTLALPTPAPGTGAAAAAAPAGMVSVPGGPFFMGCNERVDAECDDDEKPGRTVDVPAFKIDKTEVTVAQYARCVDAGACSSSGLTMPYYTGQEQPKYAEYCNWGRRESHPINCLSWDQAVAYCEWAGKRLPTEAEWEKAARGTDGRKYSWGNAGYGAGGKVANIADATAKRQFPEFSWAITSYDDGFAATAPVGSFPAGASPYGAQDMIGNVWEWTADSFGVGRAVRGGSWLVIPKDARASVRGWLEPADRFCSVGLRCAQ